MTEGRAQNTVTLNVPLYVAIVTVEFLMTWGWIVTWLLALVADNFCALLRELTLMDLLIYMSAILWVKVRSNLYLSSSCHFFNNIRGCWDLKRVKKLDLISLRRSWIGRINILRQLSLTQLLCSNSSLHLPKTLFNFCTFLPLGLNVGRCLNHLVTHLVNYSIVSHML